MADPTNTDRALNAVLEEVRWRHPTVRISCGAFVEGPQLRILCSTQPDSTASLPDLPMVGSPVRQWLGVLEGADEIIAPAIADDPRFDGVDEIIMGAGTVGTAAFVLRQHDTVSGFVRIDARAAEDLAPTLLEAVRNALPAAALAVELERARVENWTMQRGMLELESTMRAHRQRDREGLGAVQEALQDLRDRLRRVATGLEPGPKQAVEASLADGTQRIEALLRRLAEPLAEAQ
ncbi:MAG: hypothetical protein AAF721_32710 [Myxococcota bacterium]